MIVSGFFAVQRVITHRRQAPAVSSCCDLYHRAARLSPLETSIAERVRQNATDEEHVRRHIGSSSARRNLLDGRVSINSEKLALLLDGRRDKEPVCRELNAAIMFIEF